MKVLQPRRKGIRAMPKLVLALSFALALLAFPAAAGATQVTVNNNGDAPDLQQDLSCDTDSVTAGEQCSLRAAIQTVNFSSDFSNTIGFSLPVGQKKITLGSELPAIIKPTLLTGGFVCGSDEDHPEPCAEVGYATQTALPVLTFAEADAGGGTSGVSSLALTNGSVGLRITGQTQGMFVTRMWVGLHLDGSPGPNTVGISVDGNPADGNAIGGNSVTARNVIAFNTLTGIDIDGADDTTITGNYIGSKADGVTQAGNGSASSEGENIEVATSATGTRIGGTVSATAEATQECDDVCNVIIDAGQDVAGNFAPQIDLRGESAVGETESSNTTIRGNYIGMAADGATTISRGTRGIAVSVAGSDGVVVGGPAAGDRNRFSNNGSVIANLSTADNLIVENNWINLTFDGTAVDNNALHLGIGMNLSGNDNSPPLITGNRIAWVAFSNFAAIGGAGEAFVITNNVIGRAVGGAEVPGGGLGIHLSGLTSTVGSVVSGNVIDGVASAQPSTVPAGIHLVGSDGVEVFNNTIDASGSGTGAQGDGIRIEVGGAANASTSNVIGGDLVDEANAITADRDAIRLEDTTAQSNTFGRNIGAADADESETAPNTDLFIDIGSDGLGNGTAANSGLEAPSVDVAGANVAFGTADADAVVRVFTRPVDGSRDAVGEYLGKTTADGNGAWHLDYASPVAEDVLVAATQTDASGSTSELSTALETDATPPPAPAITGGPTGPTADTTPTFTFSANEAGGSLYCQIDQGSREVCNGGTFTPSTPLADGSHRFRVVHEDLGENVSPAATRKFIVDTKPPQTIGVKRRNSRFDRTPTFRFRSSEAGSTFQCRLDRGRYRLCRSPYTTRRLRLGRHVLRVRAIDGLGHVDPTPLVRRFKVRVRPVR